MDSECDWQSALNPKVTPEGCAVLNHNQVLNRHPVMDEANAARKKKAPASERDLIVRNTSSKRQRVNVT